MATIKEDTSIKAKTAAKTTKVLKVAAKDNYGAFEALFPCTIPP